MALTIDRPDYTASELNDVFEDLRTRLAYNLPPNIRSPLDSTLFDDLELNESDDVAISVVDPASVARALAFLANSREDSNENKVAGMFQYTEDADSNSTINVVNRVTDPDKVDPARDYVPSLHASVTMTTGLTVSSLRYVTDDSVGWYESGFTGKEEFTEGGFDGWYTGAGTTITTWYIDDVGYDEWGSGTAYLVGTETFDDGWPQGVEPSSGSCGGSDLDTEDLSSQAGSASGIFTLSNAYELGTLRVYWNGQRQDDSTVTEINNLQFNFLGTFSGDRVVVDYSPA